MAVQHRQRAGHVEAADDDRDERVAERPRNIECAGILIRLHADKCNQPKAGMPLNPRENRRHVNVRIGFVDDRDVDADVRSKHLPLDAIRRDAVDGGKRI